MASVLKTQVRCASAMKKRSVFLVFCSAVLLVVVHAARIGSALGASVKPEEGALEVTVDSGRLTVHAHQARLTDVLAIIGRQTGVTMVLQGALDSPVSVVFSNLPLDEGIRRLTRWHSIVMIYDPADGAKDPALTEVWVTGSIRSEVAAGDRPRNEARAEASTSVDARDSVGLSTASTALSKLNEETRRQEIEALTRAQGEYAVVNTLREAALLDPSPITRYRAIEALASMQNPIAVDALRSIVSDLRTVVTTSSDPQIRRRAVQVLASIKSPEAVDALRAVLGDPHPAVVSEARRALVRLSRAVGNSVR